MDHRRFGLLAVALLLVSLLATLQVSLDPLAEFRNPDGSISIPGGSFTPEIQRLLFPSEPSHAEWTYAPVRSAYPTLAFEAREQSRHEASPPTRADPAPWRLPDLRPFVDLLGTALPLDWLVGTASATFPVIQMVSSGADSTADANGDMTMPATVNSGDLLVACFSSTSSVGHTTPPGWTIISGFPGDRSARTTCYHRTANGTEDGTTATVIMSGSSQDAWIVYRITGQHSATSPSGATSNNINAAPDPPSFNPAAWDVEDTLWIAGDSWEGVTEHTAYPANYTLGQTNADSGTTSASIEETMAGRNLAAASEDPGTFGTTGISSWVAWTIAIRPASLVCPGTDRYWIGGTGNWSDGTHWADESGGVGDCVAPSVGNAVFFDASSGVGTTTIDVPASAASLTTTNSTITVLAKGTQALTISGSATVDNLGITSTSGNVSINGDVSLTADAYIDFGSENWTVSGAWTNSSTSASWDGGSGMVTFTSSSDRTMAFAGTNLSETEFNDVKFRTSSTSSVVTFTMGARGITARQINVEGDGAVSQPSDPAPAWSTHLVFDGTVKACHIDARFGDSTLFLGDSDISIVESPGTGACDVSFNVEFRAILNGGTSTVTSADLSTLDFEIDSGGFWNLVILESAIGYNSTGSAETLIVNNDLTIGTPTHAPQWLDLCGNPISLSNLNLVVGNDLNINRGGLFWRGSCAGSPTVTIGGSVVITDTQASTAAYIEFGSSAWTVSGDWLNDSQATSFSGNPWSAGTGSMTFNSPTGASIRPGDHGLVEFNSVLFTGGPTFTLTTQNLNATTITVSDSNPVSLVTGPLNLIFRTLALVGSGALVMDGVAVSDMEMETSAGTIALTAWSSYNEAAKGDSAAWTFNPNTTGATVTITDSGLVAGETYLLLRDTVAIDTETSDESGTVSFSVTGGWSPHDMTIQRVSVGGVGGGPTPAMQPSSVPSLIAFGALAIAVIAAIMLLGSLALGLWRALRPWLVVILIFAAVIYLVFA